jgi:hypothetical protein
MEQWGIETYFSIATLAPEYMPELKDNLFVWPNFVDPEVYQDYHQHKIIPVTLTGQVNGLYPWRQKVFPIIRDRYPCLASPQHTYESKLASQLLAGEAYARALNASLVVPTCGTMAGDGRQHCRRLALTTWRIASSPTSTTWLNDWNTSLLIQLKYSASRRPAIIWSTRATR